MFEAAAAEPGVAEVWANAERLRLEGYRAIIELLAAKQPLAAGHTPDSATDILFVLLGPDTFRAFTHGRGWPPEQWKTWVTATLERDLFTQPAPPSSGTRPAHPATHVRSARGGPASEAVADLKFDGPQQTAREPVRCYGCRAEHVDLRVLASATTQPSRVPIRQGAERLASSLPRRSPVVTATRAS